MRGPIIPMLRIWFGDRSLVLKLFFIRGAAAPRWIFSSRLLRLPRDELGWWKFKATRPTASNMFYINMLYHITVPTSQLTKSHVAFLIILDCFSPSELHFVYNPRRSTLHDWSCPLREAFDRNTSLRWPVHEREKSCGERLWAEGGTLLYHGCRPKSSDWRSSWKSKVSIGAGRTQDNKFGMV